MRTGEHADIIVESRGRVEDNQIKEAYVELITQGAYFGDGAHYQQAYPEEELVVKPKNANIAGLQLADVFAFGQKVQTILENDKPFPRPLGNFDRQLANVVDILVNQYGRYFLE